MLNLLELAKKWLTGARFEIAEMTPELFTERDAFNKRVGEIWLAYHNNEPWAQAKLAAGLHLTPEALIYMEREVNARSLARQALLKNLNIKDPADVEAISISRSEPHSDGGSSGADSEGGV